MKFKILEKVEIAPSNKLIKVDAPQIARKAKAGQFVVLRIDETGERIPLTLADWSSESITLVFQEVGKTTYKLGELDVGDFIEDLIGPLGKPTEVEEFGRVVCVGGGVGIAPIYPIARALKEKGNEVIIIIGARNEKLLFFEDELQKYSDELKICTDDGSKGFKGFVSEMLKQVISEKQKIDRVFAIGPSIMMKVVSDVTKPLEIKTIVSLNPIMLDGTGMCGVCRVEVEGKTRFACVDGPDFDAHKVNFELLMARQKIYLEEEKKSLELYLESRREKIGL